LSSNQESFDANNEYSNRVRKEQHGHVDKVGVTNSPAVAAFALAVLAILRNRSPRCCRGSSSSPSKLAALADAGALHHAALAAAFCYSTPFSVRAYVAFTIVLSISSIIRI